jgi:hypothetical protein
MLSNMLGLEKEELEEIAAQFHDRQEAHNAWRWKKAEQAEKNGDIEKAMVWREKRCMLCDSRMITGVGGVLCSCYRQYGIGYMEYLPVKPDEFLIKWESLGGVWEKDDKGKEVRTAGTREAAAYLATHVYSGACRECESVFHVNIGEILRVAKYLKISGSPDHYRIRVQCTPCKDRKRNEHEMKKLQSTSSIAHRINIPQANNNEKATG